MSVLDIQNVSKSFGSVEVIKDVSITMAEKDFLVLVGPSGCGKSTLLNCIAGLEEPTSGVISINGRDMVGVSPKDRDIAMVFQSYALYPTMNVAKNITFGMQVRGEPAEKRAEALDRVSKLLKIEALLDRKPAQLSGGQRQRVAMGRALVREPHLFLFDEPLSNLDAKLRIEMRTEIKKLHHRLGANIVYVTHDQTEAMSLATRIAVLHGGVLAQLGPPQEVYDRPASMFVGGFIGSPTMNFLPGRFKSANGALKFVLDCVKDDGAELMIEGYDFAKPAQPDQPAVLGIRPEMVNLATKSRGSGAATFKMSPSLIESNGHDKYAMLEFGSQEIEGRFTPKDKLELGTPVSVRLDLSHISFFDPESGLRL